MAHSIAIGVSSQATTPRVYVACLAAYNNGILHGEWIDATDADEMREAIQGMLERSPEPGAEEYAIHDHDFHGVHIGEYDDLDRVAEIGALIEEHGAAFAAYADNVGIDHATADGFQDAYCGEWDSERHYAEDLFDETHEIPDDLANYIDYDSFAHDLFMCDCYSVSSESGVFVFRNE
jgi:antirestriction protein